LGRPSQVHYVTAAFSAARASCALDASALERARAPAAAIGRDTWTAGHLPPRAAGNTRLRQLPSRSPGGHHPALPLKARVEELEAALAKVVPKCTHRFGS